MPPKSLRIALGALFAVFVASSPSRAFTPCPQASSSNITSCLLELSQDIQRRSIKDGGTVNANVAFSSSITVGDNATFGASVTFNGGVYGTIHQSTYTWLDSDNRISNSIGVGLAGSTITYISAGTRVRFVASGGEAVSPNGAVICTFCYGGAGGTCDIGRYTAARPMFRSSNAENSSSAPPLSIYAESTAAVAAGSLTVFLTCNGSASVGIRCDRLPCFLRVEDIH